MNAAEWVILAVVVLGIVIAIFGWDRYRGGRRKSANNSSGSEPTGEVFIDPATGRRMRVWYDPASGHREYRAELDAARLPPRLACPTGLTHVDEGIYWTGGQSLHDVGCLQCSCRGAPSRNPGRADRRREGGRGDRDRPVDVSALGFEAPTGAQ